MLDDPLQLSTGLPRQVTLRRLTSADAVAFADHVARDGERLQEHLAWPAVTASPEGAEAWLGAYDRGENGRVLVAGAWSDGELLGGAVLFDHDATNGSVELGCWVVAAGEGHGLASATCRAVLALARADLGVERVEWHAGRLNARSRRLAERLGFVYEGTLRSNYALRGARLDTDVLSLVGGEIDRALAD
jgi:ribosomal-protein-serine acetyltransferase